MIYYLPNYKKYWLILLFGIQPFFLNIVLANDVLLTQGDNLVKQASFELGEDNEQKAIQLFEQARSIYRKITSVFKQENQWGRAYDTQLKIVLTYKEQGENRTALDSLLILIPEAEQQLEPNNEILAVMYHKKGLLLFEEDGKEFQALQDYSKALHIRENNEVKNWEGIIWGYSNIGATYWYLDSLEKAKYNLEIAQSHLDSLPSNLEDPKITLYQRLAKIYGEYSDLDKAKEVLEFSLDFYNQKKSLTNDENINKALAFEDYGKVLKKLYRFKEAELAYQKAISIFRGIPNIHQSYIANTLNNQGLLYIRMDAFPKALTVLEESLRLNQILQRKYHIQDNQLNLGLLYNKTGNYRKALSLLKELRDENINSSDPESKKFLSLVYDNMGDSYGSLNREEEALAVYNKSIALISNNFSPNNLLKNPNIRDIGIEKMGVLTTLASKAKTLHALYQKNDSLLYLEGAYITYQKVDTLVNSIRQDFLVEGSQISLVSKTKPIYEQAITLSQILFKKTKNPTYKASIYEFMESSKAVILTDAIRHGQASSLTEWEKEKEKEINLNLNFYTEKLFSNPDNKNYQEAIIKLKDQKSQFVKELEKQNRKYFEYKYKQTTPAIDDLQPHLSDSTAIIEFFVGSKQSHVLMVTSQEGLTIHTLPLNRSTLEGIVDTFMRSIYTPFTDESVSLEQANIYYADYSFKLYKLLIAPLGLEKYSKLVIVPDEIISFIPFDALLRKKVPEEYYSYYENKNQYDYLMYNHQISYSYSISLWQLMQQPKYFKGVRKILAFNTQEFDAQITKLQSQLGDLFFVPLKENSTKYNYKDQAGEYQFLHFSAHGVMNSEQPNQSHFLLRADQEKERPLYLSTIYNTPLKAEVVVTSSCDGGIGKVSKGEGVLSLARGFSYAGARSVITSLWEIKDGPSGDLLNLFYANLKSKYTKDQSLKLAKEKFIRENGGRYKHPYYWAAFIPIGNMQSVSFSSNYSMVLQYSIPLIFFFFLCWYLGIRKK